MIRYINTLCPGERIREVYLCRQKQSLLTKAGKPYENLTLQDKTGTLNGKIWDVNSSGIEDFECLDYVCVMGDVVSFQGALQLNIKCLQKVDPSTLNPQDYVPTTRKNIDQMYESLLSIIDSLKNPYLKSLAESFFRDPDFAARFKNHSAAKSVHHGYLGGLLEHTLSVTQLCDFYCRLYPFLNRDLLLTAAMCHDIGKLEELSDFPANDYTDEGQLIGHIVIGAGMVRDRAEQIPDFPKRLESELVHCIISHHGKLEYGSPKTPELAEALALSFADNTDAKIETMKEALSVTPQNSLQWLGYNRFLDSNIRRTVE